MLPTINKFYQQCYQILVYMHNYTCAESCIPQTWPEKFLKKNAQQFSHPMDSWMNY